MLKKSLFTLIVSGAAFVAQAVTNPVDYVNTLMGTQSKFELSNGNTTPTVCVPWGMNEWIPQTGKNGDGWSYTYNADKIRGFKQTHRPSPWINDFGQFSLMPETGELVINEDKRASWFSHKAEVATPYYYSVYLADYDVTTELTSTDRAAAFRFTFPEDNAYVVIDAYDRGSWIKVIPEENKIVGYNTRHSGGVGKQYANYFVVVFDKPFDKSYVWSGDEIVPDKSELKDDHVGAAVGFKTKRGEQITAKVASSFISVEQAEINLKEIGARSFDAVKSASKAEWNKVLSVIDVESDNVDQLRTFYSCFFRALVFPHKMHEIDAKGNVVHYSPFGDGGVAPGYFYTGTGFWDTFRCLFPLINLLYPTEGAKMQEGWLNYYKESGFLPEWSSPGHRGCMVGNNSASVVADGIIKGLVSRADAEQLYEAMVFGANHVHPEVSSTGRCGYEYYNKLGYVPYNVGINENVARTLEYAYDDWCIYQVGKFLGKPDSEIEVFKKHSMNYKNVFCPENKLMRGRNEDGTFQSPFSPLKWGDAFTEGNSLHYTWSVFHDVAGLIDLMGGKKAFAAKLDDVFAQPPHFDNSYYGQTIHEIREMQIMNMGNYAHGNQPIQHMIYLYSYANEPWKAQYWVRQVMNKLYMATPDGYCGDEDNGQTSAWYVFSALGFYPVCSAGDQYVLGTPLFKKATINLENGNKVVIKAPNNSAENIYVKSIFYNGKNYTKNYYDYNSLLKGAVINVTMDSKPNKTRGITAADLPYSFSTAK
ncbi:MAG: GH92 family glycosyl hydrolase [Muribaculaceae bacterium]